MSIYRSVEGVNREITSISRCIEGVNKEIKEVNRCNSGVNREVYHEKLVLYDNGNSCSTITGGYTKNTAGSNSDRVSFSQNSSSIIISMPSNSASCILYTVNKIDVTNYSKLCFEASLKTASIGIAYPISGASSYTVYASNNCDSDRTKQTFYVDIGDVSGSYYPYLRVTSGSGTTTIYKIWLE